MAEHTKGREYAQGVSRTYRITPDPIYPRSDREPLQAPRTPKARTIIERTPGSGFPQFSNDWLVSALRSEKKRSKTKINPFNLIPYAAEVQDHLISELIAYQGTKIVVSFPDRTDLPPDTYPKFFENVIRRALCLAELVIVVPAPNFAYCTGWEPPIEFSRGGSVGLHRDVWANLTLLRGLEETLSAHPSIAESGAVTFLPFLGKYPHRWDHPGIEIPELPSAIRCWEDRDDERKLLLEATLDLITERLMAESLGAAHLNPNSFEYSAVNDLELLRTPGGKFAHATLPSLMPLIDGLPLSDLVILRRELQEPFAEFSNAVFARSKPSGRYYLDREAQHLESRILESIKPLVSGLRDLRKKSAHLTGKLIIRSTVFALGTAGYLGDVATALAFLAGGGAVWDLTELITSYKKYRLLKRQNSIFTVAEKLRNVKSLL